MADTPRCTTGFVGTTARVRWAMAYRLYRKHSQVVLPAQEIVRIFMTKPAPIVFTGDIGVVEAFSYIVSRG